MDARPDGAREDVPSEEIANDGTPRRPREDCVKHLVDGCSSLYEGPTNEELLGIGTARIDKNWRNQR